MTLCSFELIHELQELLLDTALVVETVQILKDSLFVCGRSVSLLVVIP